MMATEQDFTDLSMIHEMSMMLLDMKFERIV